MAVLGLADVVDVLNTNAGVVHDMVDVFKLGLLVARVECHEHVAGEACSFLGPARRV
jgi:hypothetical protein